MKGFKNHKVTNNKKEQKDGFNRTKEDELTTSIEWKSNIQFYNFMT